MITFFEQAGVNEEDEKAADRRSGQCPRNSEQLHPGVGRLVADRDSRAAGKTHSTSAHRPLALYPQAHHPGKGFVSPDC